MMFEEVLALLAKPDNYVCAWRDGELYVEPVDPPARADELRRNETSARAIAAGGEGLAA
jgi:hypothetical protein